VTETPLALDAALNEPQVLAEFPGVQLQFTFPESFSMVGVMVSVAPSTNELGVGVGTVLNETDGVGGGVVVVDEWELPPQAIRAPITPKLTRRRIDLLNVIEREEILRGVIGPLR
jgi:hypothetical protein